jgi:hypothetical protein
MIQPSEALVDVHAEHRSGPDQRPDRHHRWAVVDHAVTNDGGLELAEGVHEDPVEPCHVLGHGQEPGVRVAGPVREHGRRQVVRVDRHAARQADRLGGVTVFTRARGVQLGEVEEQGQRHPRRGEEHV